MSAPVGVAQSAQYAAETAAAARTAQLAVRAALLRDVTRLWPLLNQQDVSGTFAGWVAAMTALLNRYHMLSATAAARFYAKARQAATLSATPADLIQIPGEPSREWITRALGFAGPGMLERDAVRPGTALSTTLGTSARIALQGGRDVILDTVKADPVAVGWYRVTDGHPCAFCGLLAGRGISYKSEHTADFKAHNDCGCSAAPAFSSDQELPAISREAAQVYAERGSGDALKAFRKAWEQRTGST